MVLHGMLEVPCATPGEAFGCLDAGSRSRCVLPNSPNGGNDNCVNQSHGVFVVTLRQEWIEGKKKKKPLYNLLTIRMERRKNKIENIKYLFRCRHGERTASLDDDVC